MAQWHNKANPLTLLPMSITLNPEQTAMIQELMTDGAFQSADEVLQAALVLLIAERKAQQEWLAATRNKVTEGIAALDRGEKVDGETFVNGLLHQLQQSRQNQP
jgi:antitoxin ParD1/3/4